MIEQLLFAIGILIGLILGILAGQVIVINLRKRGTK
jgi:hypothetical protein